MQRPKLLPDQRHPPQIWRTSTTIQWSPPRETGVGDLKNTAEDEEVTAATKERDAGLRPTPRRLETSKPHAPPPCIKNALLDDAVSE